MKIVFLGSGNVATHLSQALNNSVSNEVVQVYSPTVENAKTLAEILSCGYCTDVNEVDVNADIYVCSVKDSVQQNVWRALKSHFVGSGINVADKIVVHTAGALAMDGENGLSEFFPNCGVVYPVQSFSKQRAVDLSHTPFLIEATIPSTLEKLRNLVATVSDRCYDATTKQRNALHPAAVFASNFANHMYAIANRLMEKNGLPFEILIPLIQETAQKVTEVHPVAAQTGPAVRGDEVVMSKQEKGLTADGYETELEIYRLISKNIQTYRDEFQRES
ncbi:MAG: DUF2520 domain-containing protein [Bacteroidales bacterium]|jgi:predicted short-subunit dehydrogenase-like oxidoreductase (DUF2520 family)|nr:DUF2520 domain-containing protein [Bacteroidales bacterium]